MKNRVIALAMTLAMVSGSAFAQFTDVRGNWAEDDINAMAQMNVMTGYNDGQFHADAWMTRSEFANMGLKTVNMPPSKLNTLQGFRQVSRNEWGFNDINDQAMLSNYPQGVYRPSNPLRRVEVLAAMGGSLDQPLVSEAEANQILSRYSDADQIPANARRQVATAIRYDLFENNPQFGNELRPLAPATRADVAVALNNMHENRAMVMGYDENAQVAQTTTTTRTTTTTTRSTTGTTTTGVAAAVNLPANTTFTGTVAKGFFSEMNKPGDKVVVILDHAIFAADGTVVAPAGSRIEGEITRVVSYNRARELAEVGILFNELVTPVGDRVAINASIASPDGVLKADQLEGIVIHPQRSVAALQSEYRTAQGGLVGTKAGKEFVLAEPFVTLGSSQMVGGGPGFHPQQEVLVGVGDRLQLRIDSVGGQINRPTNVQ